MKPRYLFCAALLAIAPVDHARAQSAQTVEGAQEFLRLALENGSATATIFFEKTGVTRTDRTFEKVFLQGWVYDPEKVTSHPVTGVSRPVTGLQQQSSCVSAVTGIGFSQGDRVQQVPSEHHPNDHVWKTSYSKPIATALAPPIQMDWTKIAIARGGRGIEFASSHPRFGRVLVTFSAADSEMLDRIEYAGRFLLMSCDPAARTGF